MMMMMMMMLFALSLRLVLIPILFDPRVDKHLKIEAFSCGAIVTSYNECMSSKLRGFYISLLVVCLFVCLQIMTSCCSHIAFVVSYGSLASSANEDGSFDVNVYFDDDCHSPRVTRNGRSVTKEPFPSHGALACLLGKRCYIQAFVENVFGLSMAPAVLCLMPHRVCFLCVCLCFYFFLFMVFV
jgi:hypothetical protein